MVEEALGALSYIKSIGQQLSILKPCSHADNQTTSYITHHQLLRWQGYIYLGASTVFDWGKYMLKQAPNANNLEKYM